MPEHRESIGLSKERILAALVKLNELLQQSGTTGELCLFGGTVMVLAFNARLSTRDVDAIFQPTTLMRDLSAKVAAEIGLPENWLNDGVKGFQSANPALTSETLPQFSHLRLLRPTAEYLLAMKCLAARTEDAETSGDKRDIVFLALHLKLSTVEQLLANVSRFFPPERILPKTQFMIHEIVAELARNG
jgi:hypothetical protein